MRTRDPDTLQPHDDAVWTDYDDDERYSDYTVAGASGAAADLRGYEPGLWQREASGGLTAVPLADQIGTMRQMMIGSATKRRQVYTAFGEAVHAWESVPGHAATATRYQYAGDWGYETGLLAVEPQMLAIGPPVEVDAEGPDLHGPGGASDNEALTAVQATIPGWENGNDG